MKILPYIHRIIIKRSNYTLNVIASFLLKNKARTQAEKYKYHTTNLKEK